MSASLRMSVADRREDGLGLPPVLEIFLTLLVALSGVCLLVEGAAKMIYRFGAPYDSPLLHEWFPDLLYFEQRFQNLHQMRFFTYDPLHPFMYPAPVALPYIAWFSLGENAIWGYLGLALAAVVGAAVLVGRALRRRGLRWSSTVLLLVGAVFLSYPLFYMLRQANVEAVVWLVLSVGLCLFFSGRRYAAAVCFGVVGAMKLYPLIFLGLLLSRRHYRAVAVGLVVAVAVTGVSLYVVYPDIVVSWRMIQHGLDQFRYLYMLHLRWLEQGADHSLWCMLKRFQTKMPRPDRLEPYLTAYLAGTACAGVAIYVFRIRKLPAINQVLCLTAAMLVLPPTSYDYTLMHLYAPWALLSLLAVRAWREQERVPGLLPAMVCFGVLMAPEAEFIHLGESLSGPIKAITLLVLFWVGLRYRFDDDLLDAGSGSESIEELPDGAAA